MITLRQVEETLKEMGLQFETQGNSVVHASRGRFAPVVNSILTVDEDGSAATILVALDEEVPQDKRVAVCELLNLVHGQSLWNVRFHLDETGQVFSVGKVMLWGKPYNPTQFGDIFFSNLVSTDRLHPSLVAILRGGKSPVDAFELFFTASSKQGNDDPET